MIFQNLSFVSVPAEARNSRCDALLNIDVLSPHQLRDLGLRASAVEAFCEAFGLEPGLKTRGQWSLGHCVFSALCVWDIPHGLRRN